MPWVDIKDHPFASDMPENWMPMDSSADYELVPLNPESVAYHLVASEFHRSIPNGRKICDVFRLQNPFLWHKFTRYSCCNNNCNPADYYCNVLYNKQAYLIYLQQEETDGIERSFI